ncbi:hemerythrin domain-containing protein [Saccharothrix sp. NPDC042600]|uniref:hemerythrin domain-containing protein n=1 Tax=Saccharothrix TaxID=2071 RepID=UPI0033D4AF4D|nr:hypothetical protein GCM10017745_28880 [Saccharothrix mutabilis subsp. capreolus]
MTDRITAFGHQLVRTHVALREQLADLRDDLDAWLDGDRLVDLRAHCLAFCGALTHHHTAEDGRGFPVLAAHHPGLTPVIEELVADHRIIVDAMNRLAAVLADPDPETVESEVDTLAALLETHFTYEERKIVNALNALDVAGAQADDLRAATTLPAQDTGASSAN